VYATAGVLSIAAGVVFGFAEGWDVAWGWFSAALPWFLLSRQQDKGEQ
jgi:hypothetical protein